MDGAGENSGSDGHPEEYADLEEREVEAILDVLPETLIEVSVSFGYYILHIDNSFF